MSDKSDRDSLYADAGRAAEKFVFDEKVADVFNDMIHRSVPGYDAIIAMIGVLAERYARRATNCYDLGCSLGAVTLEIERNIKNRDCRIFAIDNSQAMVDRLQSKIARDRNLDTISVILDDIRNTRVINASMVVLNFTLQFVALEERTELIQGIFAGLLPGAILVLSEKIAFPDEQENNFQIDMHHEFKKLQGYSELEISQKRAALENVLIPDTRNSHVERLRQAGFSQVHVWFQCFNFVSIVAVK